MVKFFFFKVGKSITKHREEDKKRRKSEIRFFVPIFIPFVLLFSLFCDCEFNGEEERKKNLVYIRFISELKKNQKKITK